MKFKKLFKRMAAISLVVVCATGLVACGNKKNNNNGSDFTLEKDVTINLWYSDAKMTPYLEMASAKYHEANSHVNIALNQISAENYLETIYSGSIKEGNIADLFLMSSDNMEKAYLMGLTAPNDKYNDNYSSNNYGNAAVTAASYGGKLYGYPVTFDTSVMVYNKKYVKPMNLFKDISDFSTNYQHTEENQEVEIVIQWDVSDEFLNYAMAGAYMNIGGDAAEDGQIIELDSNNIKAAMNEFLKLKADYGFERNLVKRSGCIDSFVNNKLLYTIVKASDIPGIAASGVEFGISRIPDLGSNIKTNAMSTTTMLAVNPYSKNINVAKSVANTFAYEYAGELESQTGYISARANLPNDINEEYKNLYSVYADTDVKAKFTAIGDFYLRYEIMLHQVWDQTEGITVEDAYTNFSSFVEQQKNEKQKQNMVN